MRKSQPFIGASRYFFIYHTKLGIRFYSNVIIPMSPESL